MVYEFLTTSKELKFRATQRLQTCQQGVNGLILDIILFNAASSPDLSFKHRFEQFVRWFLNYLSTDQLGHPSKMSKAATTPKS